MLTDDLAGRIHRMPKAELHLHFEGAFRWTTVRELNPQARSLPDVPPWIGKPFAGFEDFSAIFRDFILPATGTEERIERHMFEVLEDLARQNVQYAEPILSISSHMAQGLTVYQVLGSVRRGVERAQSTYPVEVKVMLGLNRGFPPSVEVTRAREAIELAGPQGWGLVAGIDLQGDDRLGIDPEFVEFYGEAKRLGLRVKVHAGEMAGPDVVRKAVEKLGAEHLSHGVRAVEDPALLRQLSVRGVWFHVCPTSNVLLGVARDYATHPVRRLLDAGCNVTLNSDDPLLFGVTVTDEYLRAASEVRLSVEEIERLALNGFRASLLAQSERVESSREIERLFSATA